MKTLTILKRTVKIDIDQIAKGLCKMHEEDKKKKTVLAFGMLDAALMEATKKGLLERVKKEFSPNTATLFEVKIEQFINECMKDISVGIYTNAKNIVV